MDEAMGREELELRLTSYHESGHAVAIVLQGWPLRLVTVGSEDPAEGGFVQMGPAMLPDWRHLTAGDPVWLGVRPGGDPTLALLQALLRQAVDTLLAGDIAEHMADGLLHGRELRPDQRAFWRWLESHYGDAGFGPTEDRRRAWELGQDYRAAEPGYSNNDLWRMLWEREREVGKALLTAWPAVEALATALVSRGTLPGDEAEAIIDGAFAGRSERSADRWAVVQRIHWAMPCRGLPGSLPS